MKDFMVAVNMIETTNKFRTRNQQEIYKDMKTSIYILIVGSMILSSCSSSNKEQGSTSDAVTETAHNHGDHDHGDHQQKEMSADENTVPSAMIHVSSSQNTKGILDAYLELKNALIASDDKKASEAGKKLVNAFTTFDKTSLTSEQLGEYTEIVENAQEQAEHIRDNAGNLFHQREHFEVLGTDVRDLVNLVGTDRTLYQTFCPMYNNKKGGMWLSEVKEIKNPFFGEKMLNCGSVQSEIMPE